LPAQQKVLTDQATRIEDFRGQETVLVVDDEEQVLNLGQTVLKTFGYKVLTAKNGVDALEVFEEAKAQIQLVITDLVMPEMTGRELVDELRRRAPRLSILCTSGYGGDRDEPTLNYLRKPFTAPELLRKVRQALTPSES
jgi:two-component system, cell cycle sensor histidine kinase and response regulator CckA